MRDLIVTSIIVREHSSVCVSRCDMRHIT